MSRQPKGWPVRSKAGIAYAVLSGELPKCRYCEYYFEPYCGEEAKNHGDDPSICHRCWHIWLRDRWDNPSKLVGRTGPGHWDCETCQRNIEKHELKGQHLKNDW